MAKLQRILRRGPVREGNSRAEAEEEVGGYGDVADPDDDVDPAPATPDEATADGADRADPADPADTIDRAAAGTDAEDGDPAADEADSAEASGEDPEEIDEADEPDGPADEAEAARSYRTPRYRGGVGRFSLREWLPVVLLQAAHPKQALVTALAMYGAAWLVGRPAREAGVILVTVLVGQTILGWHNDLVDWRRDQAHHTPGKPLADGRLSRANAWTAVIIGWLLLVPLAVTTGLTAGACYLGSVAVAMLGNVLFRTGPLSFWSWAVSFGLLPYYLSYGGWGGQAIGTPPEPSIVVLAGLLGIGVHFLRAVWGLVADHDDEWTYLPLKVGMKIGATPLLMLAVLYLIGVAVALAIAGTRVGLSQ